MSSKLAVQMFTVREHTKTAADLAETLERIGKIGYTGVQMSAVECMNGDSPEVNAKQARQMLDDNGLKCVATHRSFDNLLNSTDAEIEFHQTLGCDYAAIGSYGGDSYEAFRKFAKDAADLIEKLRPAGIRFGHHNHSFEFYQPEVGKTLEDILIDDATPELLLELDLYWIEHAGLNCARILERCHGRVPVIHLKDKEVLRGQNETRMAPIGEGNMDWKGIIPACKAAGVQWYAVEQDNCYRDTFDCLRSSYEFLSGKDL